ncbi:MAG: signal peptidase I, partial [Acidobacteriota bacterium]|nr:signal peptidase I [Acidobacteriota bacterium]
PGDTIEIRRGYVYVNGEAVDEPYVNDDYREPGFDGPWTVPADRFFVMGDHRDKSSDSRRWGTVPRELIKGRALLIWWSYEEDDDVATRRGVDNLKAMGSKLVTFPWRSRWSRCFTLIR